MTSRFGIIRVHAYSEKDLQETIDVPAVLTEKKAAYEATGGKPKDSVKSLIVQSQNAFSACLADKRSYCKCQEAAAETRSRLFHTSHQPFTKESFQFSL